MRRTTESATRRVEQCYSVQVIRARKFASMPMGTEECWVVAMEGRSAVRCGRYGRLRKCPRRSRDGRDEAGRRHLPVTGKRARVTEDVAQSAARYSQERRGGGEVCSHVWRGVVSGDIVSHPSRQQSGGVGTEDGPSGGSRGSAANVSRDAVLCDDGTGASIDPGPGTVPGTRASVVEFSCGER